MLQIKPGDSIPENLSTEQKQSKAEMGNTNDIQV